MTFKNIFFFSLSTRSTWTSHRSQCLGSTRSQTRYVKETGQSRLIYRTVRIILLAQRSDTSPLAFYHVAIDPDHTKYLSFVWNGKIFQFKVLCFGVKNAPFTFNRLGQELRKFFSQRGVSIIIYIDDILVISETSDKCRRDAQFVINKLV